MSAMPGRSFTSFSSAKVVAAKVHIGNERTLYCDCVYSAKKVDLASCGYIPRRKNSNRASRLEWEHVVPAEAFGQSFPEWREGAEHCVRNGKKFRGRRCARSNPDFARMEADLHNIWPEIGELNQLRSNYSMAELGAEAESEGSFGECRVKIEQRKFEPESAAKGRVARAYLYMDQAYPGRGIVSGKNQKLFAAWDRLHPVDAWECERRKRIEQAGGAPNAILKERCDQRSANSR
jgi:deoxyribonuclease-1